MSLWIINFLWMKLKACTIHATKNLVYSSVNSLWWAMWNLKSPPDNKSITKYKLLVSWKANYILTIKGCFNWLSIFLSFITEWILFLAKTLALYISFMANGCWSFFLMTSQTLPNPPFPIGFTNSKSFRIITARGMKEWMGKEETYHRVACLHRIGHSRCSCPFQTNIYLNLLI